MGQFIQTVEGVDTEQFILMTMGQREADSKRVQYIKAAVVCNDSNALCVEQIKLSVLFNATSSQDLFQEVLWDSMIDPGPPIKPGLLLRVRRFEKDDGHSIAWQLLMLLAVLGAFRAEIHCFRLDPRMRRVSRDGKIADRAVSSDQHGCDGLLRHQPAAGNRWQLQVGFRKVFQAIPRSTMGHLTACSFSRAARLEAQTPPPGSPAKRPIDCGPGNMIGR
jgi:hypothetical protein